MKRYEIFLFDIDGTILNTEKMNICSLMRVLKEFKNKDYKYEDLLFIMKYPGKKTLGLLGFSENEVEEVYPIWVSYVNEFKAEKYEGVVEVIKELKVQGIRCAIVSSKTLDQYKIDMTPLGIDDCFEEIILADDTKEHKPSPEPINEYFRRTAASKENAIYIGDTPSDYKATVAANIDFGLALWGATEEITGETVIDLREPKDILNLGMSRQVIK